MSQADWPSTLTGKCWIQEHKLTVDVYLLLLLVDPTKYTVLHLDKFDSIMPIL